MQNENGNCPWAGNDEFYIQYHDEEWGHPVVSDQRLFEKICLEGFQAGLSWITILRKRERFREVFDDFDFNKIARYDERDVDRLLADKGIIRHAGKINATINNANRSLEMIEEYGSLAAFFWSYEPAPKHRPDNVTWEAVKDMPSTEISKKLSKDLKKLGWKFVGPTTCYAFMQAMGLVNDHIETCSVRAIVEAKRDALKRPF